MGKKFYADAAKRFLSLSVVYVSHITRKERNPSHQFLIDRPDNNDGENVSGVFFSFLS